MSNSERLKILASRGIKFAINLGHSVLMLVVLWVSMDLLQSTVREPAKVFLTASKVQRTQVASVTAASTTTEMHDYGYHARQDVRVTQTPPVTRRVVSVKHSSCPVKAKVVLAKAIPKPETVIKSPKVMVNHVSPDARGTQPSYHRVDL